MERVIHNRCVRNSLRLRVGTVLTRFYNVVQRGLLKVEIFWALYTRFGHIRWVLFLFFTIKVIRTNNFRIEHRITHWKLNRRKTCVHELPEPIISALVWINVSYPVSHTFRGKSCFDNGPFERCTESDTIKK